MEFYKFYITSSKYGKYIINIGNNDILYYDEENLNYNSALVANLRYYHFNTEDQLDLFSDFKNSRNFLCKILKSKDSGIV